MRQGYLVTALFLVAFTATCMGTADVADFELAEDCQALQDACCCNDSLGAKPTCRNPAHKGVALNHGYTHCKRLVWAGPGGWHMLQQHVQ